MGITTFLPLAFRTMMSKEFMQTILEILLKKILAISLVTSTILCLMKNKNFHLLHQTESNKENNLHFTKDKMQDIVNQLRKAYNTQVLKIKLINLKINNKIRLY